MRCLPGLTNPLSLLLALWVFAFPVPAASGSPPDVEILRLKLSVEADKSGRQARLERESWYLIRSPGVASRELETLYLTQSYLERPRDCSVRVNGEKRNRSWTIHNFKELPSLAANALVTDSRLLALEVGPFSPGDTLHVRQVTQLEPFLGFPLLLLGHPGFPTRCVEFQADLPQELQPRLVFQNAPESSRTEEDGESGRWRIALRDVPPLPREALRPSVYDILPVVSIGVSRTAWGAAGSWPELARTYQDRLGDSLREQTPADEIPQARERWAGLQASPLNRALDLVQCNVRYVSIQLGEGGWIPTPSEEVARRRYGDCKDMALLLRDLLVEEGYPGRLALVLTRPPAPSRWDPLPSLLIFNHAVAVVESGDDLIWLDATDEQGSESSPRWDIQNAPALVIAGEQIGYHRIPLNPARVNQTRRVLTCRPGSDGSWSLTLNGEFTGAPAARFRFLKEGAATDMIVPYLLGPERDGDVVNYIAPEVTSMDISPDRVTYTARARLPMTDSRQDRPGSPATGGMMGIPEFDVFRKRTRSSDVVWALPWSRQDSIIVELPPNTVPDLADSTWSVEIAGLRVTVARRLNSGRLVLSREAVSSDGLFPADRWSDGRRLSLNSATWLSDPMAEETR